MASTKFRGSEKVNVWALTKDNHHGKNLLDCVRNVDKGTPVYRVWEGGGGGEDPLKDTAADKHSQSEPVGSLTCPSPVTYFSSSSRLLFSRNWTFKSVRCGLTAEPGLQVIPLFTEPVR